MLRWFCLLNSLAVFFTIALASSATFSAPLSPNSRYPKVENSQVDKPLCYMQVADGTTLDLQKLCGKNSPAKTNLGSRIAKSQFRQGTGKAYVTDSQ
jgi:hypothetical protein